MNTSILFDGGINYVAGVKRFVGDKDLYEEVLLDYLKDETFNQLEEAYSREDYAGMFAPVHNLKGLAGNLDMHELRDASSTLTELLRNNDAPEKHRVFEAFVNVKAAQRKAIDAINKALT